MNRLHRVLLVDDYEADNFFHQMLFEQLGCVEHIEVAFDGAQALRYLTTAVDGKFPQPELICLDINMPVMNGWEFLDQYEKLPVEQTGAVVLMMVTTSLNPDDRAKALARSSVSEFTTKPLTLTALKQQLSTHFPDLFR